MHLNLLAVLLLSRAASAQGAAAEELFEQGRAALAAGDLPTACARFQSSDRLDPAAGTRASLGTCEERRGRLASAWEAFKSALKKLPPEDPRVAKVQAQIDALGPRLPRLDTLQAGYSGTQGGEVATTCACPFTKAVSWN